MERILNTIASVLYNYNRLLLFKVLVHIPDVNPADVIVIAKQLYFNHILMVNHWCTFFFSVWGDRCTEKTWCNGSSSSTSILSYIYIYIMSAKTQPNIFNLICKFYGIYNYVKQFNLLCFNSICNCEYTAVNKK